MMWITRQIKAVMLIAGRLTSTMLYALVAPQAALQSTFGEGLDGPVAEIVVRNWGALIGLVGALLIYGAFQPAAPSAHPDRRWSEQGYFHHPRVVPRQSLPKPPGWRRRRRGFPVCVALRVLRGLVSIQPPEPPDSLAGTTRAGGVSTNPAHDPASTRWSSSRERGDVKVPSRTEAVGPGPWRGTRALARRGPEE